MLEELFLKVWRAFPAEPPVTLLLSGGGDSVALFHLLLSSGVEFRALHFQHDGDADFATASLAFCEELCRDFGVELLVRRVEGKRLMRAGDLSWEAACRTLRYRALREFPGCFLTAHTIDDQAETVLLGLLGGAGLAGLAGVSPVREDGVLRPLLGFSREQLREYLQRGGFSWLEDPSNRDGNERARVRHQVLPFLLEKWPYLTSTLARTARRLGEDEQYLRETARVWLEEQGGEGGDNWALAALRGLPNPILVRVLREFRRAFSPPYHRPRGTLLEEFRRILRKGRNDSWVNFPGGWSLGVLGERVWARPALPELPKEFDPLAPPALPDYFRVSLESHPDAVCWSVPPGATVRGRRAGDRFGGRCLKKILASTRQPPWVRDRWPLLVCGGQVVRVWGLEEPETTPALPSVWVSFSPQKL